MRPLIILAVLLLPCAAQAQRYFDGAAEHPFSPTPAYESDILYARPIRFFIGVHAGAYAFQHQGSFSPSCACEFSGETGAGVTYGGELSLHYPKIGFAFKLLVAAYDYSADFSYREVRESVEVGDRPNRMVEYEKTSSVKLGYLSIVPSVAVYPGLSPFHFIAGLEIGVPLEYRYDNVERIITPDVYYYDGTRENVLLPEQDIPGGDDLRFSVVAGIGYDIALSSVIYLTPQLGLIVPMTSVSSTDADWKVLNEYALLMFKVRL